MSVSGLRPVINVKASFCVYTNLLECLNDCTLTVQRKKSVTVAYIDFNHAFNSISHNKLLAKLYTNGIRGSSITFQYVHIKPGWVIISDEATMISRVVQGSSIGPVSFLIFVDELAKILERHRLVTQ